jgi:hypothetical protein
VAQRWPGIMTLAVSLLTLASMASAQNDQPPSKPTWDQVADDTIGCIHEEWTQKIWEAWDGPQYRDLPYSTALTKLLSITDEGECKIFPEGQWVLIDHARVDPLEGFGPDPAVERSTVVSRLLRVLTGRIRSLSMSAYQPLLQFCS